MSLGLTAGAIFAFIVVFFIVFFIVKVKYKFKSRGNTRDYVSNINFTYRDDTFFNTHTSRRKIDKD
jgi:hypothetical protein